MFFTTLLALAFRTLLSWENRKLDKKYGTLEEQRARARVEGEEIQTRAVENEGPTFRYVL